MHFEVGDIVVRSDIKGRKRFRITRIASDGSGWISAVPVGGGSTVTFPSQFMIRKVNAGVGAVGGGGSTRKRGPGDVVKLKDRERGEIVLNVVNGVVVGAMGSEPARYMGLALEDAKRVARHGGTGGTKTSKSRFAKASTFDASVARTRAVRGDVPGKMLPLFDHLIVLALDSKRAGYAKRGGQELAKARRLATGADGDSGERKTPKQLDAEIEAVVLGGR